MPCPGTLPPSCSRLTFACSLRCLLSNCLELRQSQPDICAIDADINSQIFPSTHIAFLKPLTVVTSSSSSIAVAVLKASLPL